MLNGQQETEQLQQNSQLNPQDNLQDDLQDQNLQEGAEDLEQQQEIEVYGSPENYDYSEVQLP